MTDYENMIAAEVAAALRVNRPIGECEMRGVGLLNQAADLIEQQAAALLAEPPRAPSDEEIATLIAAFEGPNYGTGVGSRLYAALAAAMPAIRARDRQPAQASEADLTLIARECAALEFDADGAGSLAQLMREGKRDFMDTHKAILRALRGDHPPIATLRERADPFATKVRSILSSNLVLPNEALDDIAEAIVAAAQAQGNGHD